MAAAADFWPPPRRLFRAPRDRRDCRRADIERESRRVKFASVASRSTGRRGMPDAGEPSFQDKGVAAAACQLGRAALAVGFQRSTHAGGDSLLRRSQQVVFWQFYFSLFPCCSPPCKCVCKPQLCLRRRPRCPPPPHCPAGCDWPGEPRGCVSVRPAGHW
jgi:hypothetical protein